ncbi:MAG: hypothetical protein RIF46_09790 [Cyclobacteriaceae bacterium]
MTKQFIFLFGIMTATLAYGQKYCCGESGAPQFDGNDLISYYDGKILKGSPGHKVQIDGQVYLFHNEANRIRFQEDPQKYLPSYGGWCSIAMSLDALVEPNYNYYRFDQNGKILFFEVRAFLNGITLWEKDTIGNKIKADRNYKNLLNAQNK